MSSLRGFLRKPFVLFTILLILKGYLAWAVTFHDLIPWKPIITEIPFIWLVFCLIEWFAGKRKFGAYVIANLLLTTIFFAVIMYFKYYGVIATYHALEQVNQVTAVRNSVFSLMDPYYLLIYADIVVIFIIMVRRRKVWQWKDQTSRRARRGVVTVLFILSLVICLFNIVPNRASMNEIKKAQQMGILNYEAYTIFSKKKEDIVPLNSITQASIDELKGLKKTDKPQHFGDAKGKNVIIIQLESFQNFLINLKIDGQEITPNMNKLAKEQYYFPNFNQMVGQGNTSDAEFVVNTSFYVPPSGAATQNYVDKKLPSLPRLMESNGYTTATFHTNDVEFWNRGELYSSLGFQHYYDKSFFGDEDSFFFGPSDEVLYKKTAAKMKEMNQEDKPFYAQVISMSAHHPFTIPESKYHMQLPERYDGTFVGDYIRAQNYADYALGQFIDELKKNGLWDDSLIVIYGDHMGLPLYSLDRDDKELMKEIYGHEYSYSDMINIPLILAGSSIKHPEVNNTVGGQVDILPTVANLTGVSAQDHIHFGQDLLNQSYNLIPERYYLPTGSFLTNNALFVSGAGYEDGAQYPLSGRTSVDEGTTEDEYNRALKLLNLSDSYVNQQPLK
ncbi:phosphoglycerol transferase MdoB-like AlkP superfamily enzyme [Paenibacillus rhizosphaerae]|uniref:Phosphoglycerol transferase MdoB-like AlkP superfamily enzyme n=1 Tax=Paenibacillus rhizosphaerae TaxID=297318 RepID=A0A839TZD9_9BACL|nr:LTA synthase family protein [Paenibacillus rhizosphaerae]MBB3130768.1 phosphoglycerol transferase MdoB-like AlkP superfamily enzyme [Paenibacillus rhizosphaerae]